MVCTIHQLKRAGITQIELVRIYVSVIRPVVEHACPVWHTNLPKYLTDNIEINIPTLHDRRNAICKAYLGRMRRGDHKLNKLLPDTPMVSYALRSFKELLFPGANTNGYKIHGVWYTVKHLNGLSGMF